jgi:hypothetical protein
MATTPPVGVAGGFFDIGNNAILYVPAGSVSVYQQIPNLLPYTFSEIRGL